MLFSGVQYAKRPALHFKRPALHFKKRPLCVPEKPCKPGRFAYIFDAKELEHSSDEPDRMASRQWPATR